MPWTTPRTWATDELVTAALMNEQVRDNESYLFENRPKQAIKRDNGANYTTTSTSFTDVDGTNLAITITTSGTILEVGMSGAIQHSLGGNPVYFDVLVDGTRFGNGFTEGCYMKNGQSGPAPDGAAFSIIITGLSAGSHTLKLQWRVASGTGKLHSGNGASGEDFLLHFWAREVG